MQVTGKSSGVCSAVNSFVKIGDVFDTTGAAGSSGSCEVEDSCHMCSNPLAGSMMGEDTFAVEDRSNEFEARQNASSWLRTDVSRSAVLTGMLMVVKIGSTRR